MTKDDLRLRYIVANKEIATAETLREMVLRAFAGSFADDDNVATAEIVISALSRAVLDLAERAYQEACEDLEDDQPEPPAPTWFSGAGAEDFYHKAAVRCYLDAGFDKRYAEEAASWPDVLNHDTRYPVDLLVDFARLEVGHDLLVGDYIRATVANNYFKTEPLSAGATQSDGSAQQ